MDAGTAGIGAVTTEVRLPLGLDRLRRLPGMSLALADQALVSGANFLFIIAVARSAGIEQFGLFSLSLAVVYFTGGLANAILGLPISVLLPERASEAVAPYLARLERVNRWIAVALVGLAVVFGAASGLWAIGLATALACAARVASEVHRRIAYALQDGARALLIDVAGNACLAIAAVALLLWPTRSFDAPVAMTAVAGCAICGWAAGLMLNRSALGGVAPEDFRAVAGRHWEFGRWGLGASLALWSASQLYPFLVAGFLGLREVALLNGAMRLLGLANVLMQGIESYATPRLRRQLLTTDLRSYRSAWSGFATLGCLLVTPLMVAAMVWPEAILHATLGSEFVDGAQVLRIVAATQLFGFLARLATVGLNALKEARPGFLGQVVCAVVTVAVGPLAVSRYGLDGAAWALLGNALINCIVVGVAFWLVLRRKAGLAKEGMVA
ncbi:MAG: oligosaccharide flippase family protein [Planctomycetes bacterium]|nr:oligosaccharide flippase family protein [Planctomycetota bacterium]